MCASRKSMLIASSERSMIEVVMVKGIMQQNRKVISAVMTMSTWEWVVGTVGRTSNQGIGSPRGTPGFVLV